MADLMAIVAKSRFESGGELAVVGQKLALDRYSSANKILNQLEDGGRLFMVTVRPGEELWLVGVLVDPTFDGREWTARPSEIPIIDITNLRDKLRFKTGKGIAGTVGLGAALQTPRAISDGDRVLLDKAIAGAPITKADEPAPIVNRRPGDDERMYHHLELAKSARALCDTCKKPLLKDVRRLAEVYMHGDIRNPIYRYHHVECAVKEVPLVLRNALNVRDAAQLALAPDREALLAATEQALDAERLAKRAAFAERHAATNVSREVAIGVSAKLLSELDDAPDDRGILEVLADELQAKHDPRGELITLQMAIAEDDAKPVKQRAADMLRGRVARDERVVVVTEAEQRTRRRNELLAELGPPLDTGDRAIWSTGFVARLELANKSSEKIDEMAAVWQHASLRMLRELRVEFEARGHGPPSMPTLAEVLPKTLMRLEFAFSDNYYTSALGEFSPVVNGLPRLRSFAASGRGDWDKISHGGLERLELTASYSETPPIEQITPKQMPNLTAISIRKMSSTVVAEVCAALGNNGWFLQVRELALPDCNVDTRAIKALVDGIGKKKLAKLDLSGNDIPVKEREKLAKLCDELVFPMAAALARGEVDALSVQHTGKPEWGIGTIVKRADGKLEVKFPKPVGIKVFKADAPFLKLS